MDPRQLFPDDPEEVYRTLLDAVRKQTWTVMPVKITKDSDGKTVSAKITVKGQTVDEDGKVTHVEYPLLDDVPIHFVGGGDGAAKNKGLGGTVVTHPIKKDDEGVVVFAGRPFEKWFEKGDVQNPPDLRMLNLSDAFFFPAVRSKPRELKHIDTKKTQLRSVDKKHVIQQDPGYGQDGKPDAKKGGVTIRSVESAQQAKGKEEVDPFEKPKDYYHHHIKAEVGINHAAVKDDGDDQKKTTHDHTISHGAGLAVRIKVKQDAPDGTHSFAAHPDNGVKTSVDKGAHVVDIKSGDSGGIFSVSTKTVDVSAPTHNVTAKTNITGEGHVIEATNGSETQLKGKARTTDDHTFDKNIDVKQLLKAVQAQIGSLSGTGGGALGGNAPGGNAGAGGIGSGGLSAGAAANNVGDLGGDLDGTLPNPTLADGSVKIGKLASPAFVYRAISTNTSFTATAGDLSGALLEVLVELTGALAAGRTLTLPTVTYLAAAIPGLVAGNSYKLKIRNASSGNFAWTVATNTGWTLSGTMTISQNYVREFIVTFDTLTTATLRSFGSYLTVA